MPELDLLAAEQALRGPDVLAPFNRAGILDAADIHVAVALCRLAALEDPPPSLLLAAALAVRAPRLGHVHVDLATIAETVAGDFAQDDVAGLVWPATEAWLSTVRAATPVVTLGEQAGELPLRLTGTRLSLERYWRAELRLAEALAALDRQAPRGLALDWLAREIHRLFPAETDGDQRVAACTGMLRGLTVIAGGPGTGKTTTIARLVALLVLAGVRDGGPVPLIALCAPTGRAAARLTESLTAEAGRLELPDAVRESLRGLRAVTMHRLLGARGDGRFAHGPANPLPHDVVIVDETSMVSLSMMTRLVDAVRDDGRLMLVGDPDQLSAIEAGAVLRDVVGPAALGVTLTPGTGALVQRVTGESLPAAPAGRPFGDGIVVLRRGHRFGEGIGRLADAIRHGDGDAAVQAARAALGPVTWIEADPAEDPLPALARAASDAYGAVLAAARSGEPAAALAALGRFRVLCAHRHGPYGVAGWTVRVERWLAERAAGFDPADPGRVGRPLLITENDPELRLANGDTGVLVATDQGPRAAFLRDGELALLAPSRLRAVETVYAMTIHKSQGSQFHTAVVILPDPSSRLLSRELLYTAATRAADRLVLIGTEPALRAAVDRPVARATALGERLWNPTVM
jgi:exodeoxyribonuclease V alpha subunit